MKLNTIKGAADMLREAAKQFRTLQQTAHATLCDRHADALTKARREHKAMYDALVLIRDSQDADLVAYCRHADAIACEVTAKIEEGAL